MPVVAARCFHNGIRQPVPSKPGGVPKSFATNRGYAPFAFPTSGLPTTRDRPAAQFLVTRLCGCLEQLQSDVASAGLTLVRWGRKSAGTPRRPLEHPYSGAQARASQSGSQSALSGVFLRSKPRVGAGARKAHRGSTTSDGPKCALLFNYDAAMQLSP